MKDMVSGADIFKALLKILIEMKLNGSKLIRITTYEGTSNGINAIWTNGKSWNNTETGSSSLHYQSIVIMCQVFEVK